MIFVITLIVFFSATRERLKMAVTSVGAAASSAPIGLVIIVVFVILAAVVFTKRRTRAKLKRIEIERYS